MIAADLAARAVVEGGTADGHLLFAEQLATAVGQGLDGQLQIAGQARHQAAAVVIGRVGSDRQGIALHGSTLVIQAGRVQLSERAAAENHAFAVAQVLPAVLQAEVAGQQLAVIVAQVLRGDVQAFATQQPALVVKGGELFDQHAACTGVDCATGVGQQVADAERYVAGIADQRAFTTVVEGLGDHLDSTAQYGAGAVVDGRGVEQQLFADDHAALVIQV